MEQNKKGSRDLILEEKIEYLIAIGAATAANCIPCFEHLYEKAITSGITVEQIKRASDIAGQVKKGAHTALTNSVNELIDSVEPVDIHPMQTTSRSCCG